MLSTDALLGNFDLLISNRRIGYFNQEQTIYICLLPYNKLPSIYFDGSVLNFAAH